MKIITAAQPKYSKRKRHRRTGTGSGVPASIGTVLITTNLPKKRQHSTTMESIIAVGEQNTPAGSASNWKPKCLKVPDQVFKQMLSKTSPDDTTIADLVSLLNTSKKKQFIRRYAHLLNDISYLKAELNFLDYYNRGMISHNIWT